MAVDPNLSTDTCIFMQPGASPNWWLSDDVKLAAASGVATPGVKNDVRLTVRRKSNCNLLTGTDFVRVDLYICNPTASPPVTTSGQVKKILDATTAPASDIIVDIANLPSGGSFPQTIKWDIPAIAAGSHPAETAGHKCLIARAYSNVLVTTSANIGEHAQSSDQHYAQRNICIQNCNSPCGVDVWAENRNRETRQEVTFRVVADLKPTKGVLDVALPLLNQVPGFKRVVNTSPRRGFSMEFRDFPKAKIVDNTRPGGCLGIFKSLFGGGKGGAADGPSFAAQIQLAPQQFTTYRFLTDLEGTEPGGAHIFHLMHIENSRVLSGLTLLMVKS